MGTYGPRTHRLPDCSPRLNGRRGPEAGFHYNLSGQGRLQSIQTGAGSNNPSRRPIADCHECSEIGLRGGNVGFARIRSALDAAPACLTAYPLIQLFPAKEYSGGDASRLLGRRDGFFALWEASVIRFVAPTLPS